MTIQDAVNSVVECKVTADPESSVGYLALTDCVLSTIKGAAFMRNDTKAAKVINVITLLSLLIKQHIH